MKRIAAVIILLAAMMTQGNAVEREYIWPEGLMPDSQPHQIAEMLDVASSEGFVADNFRRPFLDWFDAPENPNEGCMILISGGGYYTTCDVGLIKLHGIEELLHELFIRNQKLCCGILYHEAHPFLGVGRVNRLISRTRFQHA